MGAHGHSDEPAQFKSWVRTVIADATHDDLGRLCHQVLATDPQRAEDLNSCVVYLQRLARHFLDADSYNAAKHGMALHGGSERLQVEIEGWELFKHDGMRVSWLASWPRDDPSRPPRWTRVSRLLDEPTTMTLIFTAIMLMRSVWIRGRQRHLAAPLNEVYRPVPWQSSSKHTASVTTCSPTCTSRFALTASQSR